MLAALWSLQWKSAKPWILAAMVAVAALPVASVTRSWPTGTYPMAVFLAELDLWSLLYPVTAVAVGAAMGLLTWRSDRATGFVYALTLPIHRARYVWLRFLAGSTWLGAVAVVLWIVALLTVQMASVPNTLTAHPTRLALKFALASLSVFTATFVFGGLPERTRRIGVRVLLLLAAVQLAAVMIDPRTNVLRWVLLVLVGPSGPFAALGGRWMLIDV